MSDLSIEEYLYECEDLLEFLRRSTDLQVEQWFEWQPVSVEDVNAELQTLVTNALPA